MEVDLDYTTLPEDVLEKLAELSLELSEGEIQKSMQQKEIQTIFYVIFEIKILHTNLQKINK